MLLVLRLGSGAGEYSECVRSCRPTIGVQIDEIAGAGCFLDGAECVGFGNQLREVPMLLPWTISLLKRWNLSALRRAASGKHVYIYRNRCIYIVHQRLICNAGVKKVYFSTKDKGRARNHERHPSLNVFQIGSGTQRSGSAPRCDEDDPDVVHREDAWTGQSVWKSHRDFHNIRESYFKNRLAFFGSKHFAEAQDNASTQHSIILIDPPTFC